MEDFALFLPKFDIIALIPEEDFGIGGQTEIGLLLQISVFFSTWGWLCKVVRRLENWKFFLSGPRASVLLGEV